MKDKKVLPQRPGNSFKTFHKPVCGCNENHMIVRYSNIFLLPKYISPIMKIQKKSVSMESPIFKFPCTESNQNLKEKQLRLDFLKDLLPL